MNIWDEQPNRVDLNHRGYDCVILKQPSGHLCGYVCIPENHALYLKDYIDIDVEVHGGLTYGEVELPNNQPAKQGWWIGFDCAHSFDYSPKIPIGNPEDYKTVEFVLTELTALVDQIEDLQTL